MTELLLTGADVVTPDGVLSGGWLRVAGDRISGMGTGDPPTDTPVTSVDCTGMTLVPGFVDMHGHGGGGGSYDGGPDEVAAALALHRAHGTTTSLASLVSLRLPDLERVLAELAELATDGELAGVHLEGPWLSTVRRGAHDPTRLHAPAAGEVADVLHWGRGAIRMVTLAPELDGALPAIRTLTSAGVVAAVGHTDAGFARTTEAVAEGATVATHLCNAMSPPRAREPGPIVALLDDPRVTIELIADGVHVHDGWIRHALTAAGRDRVALVTDALPAAGKPDGDYLLGGLPITVRDGVARLREGGALAGGTATSDVLFRRAVTVYGRSLVEAALLTAGNPARVLGLTDVGELTVGRRADVVVLDAALTVRRVLRAGRWLAHPG